MVKLVVYILEDHCKQIAAFDLVFKTVKKNHVDSKLQRRLKAKGVYFRSSYRTKLYMIKAILIYSSCFAPDYDI